MSEPLPSHALSGAGILSDPLVRELLEMRLIAVVTTLERDGSVHAVPMWIAAGEGAILLATGSASRKLRNLERDPRMTVVLHDSRPGCEVCGASIRGRVEIVRGPEAIPLVTRVHRRYVSADGLERPEVQAFLGSDDVALRFHPDRALTWDERQGGAAQALRGTDDPLPLQPTEPLGHFGSGSSL